MNDTEDDGLIIDSAAELYRELDLAGLKPASSIQALCQAHFNSAMGRRKDSYEIRVASDLLPESYVAVPAMFARTLASKVSYPAVQATIKDGYLVVIAGLTRRPTTFRGEVLAALRSEGKFIVPRSKVPKSYRRRPGLLSAILSEELGEKVCNRCKGKGRKKIKWYIDRSHENIPEVDE